jgi:hypothetical protein
MLGGSSQTYCANIDTVHDGIILAARKHVHGPLLVLGLEVGHDIGDGLGVGRDGQVADKELGVLVLVLLVRFDMLTVD